jgi:prepilin-type N-terminal cleavage/methylation domain-containing protein
VSVRPRSSWKAGPARRHGLSRRAGFTLVEILLSLAILLFGFTAVLGLLTFGAGLSRTALLRTSAASAVEAVVADLEETLFPLVEGEAGEPVDVVDREVPGLADVVYSARAVANPERPLEYRVDVELSWKTSGVRREKRFRTLLVREVPFGERLRRRFVEPGATTLAPRTDPRESASERGAEATTAPDSGRASAPPRTPDSGRASAPPRTPDSGRASAPPHTRDSKQAPALDSGPAPILPTAPAGKQATEPPAAPPSRGPDPRPRRRRRRRAKVLFRDSPP